MISFSFRFSSPSHVVCILHWNLLLLQELSESLWAVGCLITTPVKLDLLIDDETLHDRIDGHPQGLHEDLAYQGGHDVEEDRWVEGADQAVI